MRSDVHSAALRAAAKVAFSVAFLGGCSAGASTGLVDEELTASGLGGKEPGKGYGSSGSSGESGEGGKPAPYAPRAAPPASTKTPPCDEDASAPTPLTCEQAINAAFPVEGEYPGAKQAVSVQVQDCCADALTSSQGMMEAHRWDCCANLPADAGQNAMIACTPWGPPVPPAMERRSTSARPSPDAWALAVGVA